MILSGILFAKIRVMKKLFLILSLFLSVGAMASSSELPFLSIKERLRLQMWSYGLEDNLPKKAKLNKTKILPEEIERPLRKL